MKCYQVGVEQDDDWFIGTVLNRRGITTQGRTLDELVFMVRDAIALMEEEADVHLELVLSPDLKVSNRMQAWGEIEEPSL